MFESTTFSTYELWCGGKSGIINVYSFNQSGVCNHDSLTHFERALPCDDIKVTKLYGNTDFVYSYVSPSSKLYAWNSKHKTIINKLDCSKLIPCSESLKSIAIEEHLSPTKCQITSLAVLNDKLYIGTTWGCLIIVEAISLLPITVFRPYNEDVRY